MKTFVDCGQQYYIETRTFEPNINLLDILEPRLDLTPLMSQHSRYLSNLRRLGQVWAIISRPDTGPACGLSIARHYSEDIIGQLMSWLVIRTSGAAARDTDLIKNKQITNSSKYSNMQKMCASFCSIVHGHNCPVTEKRGDQITDEGRKHLSGSWWLPCHRWSNPGLMVWWGQSHFISHWITDTTCDI